MLETLNVEPMEYEVPNYQELKRVFSHCLEVYQRVRVSKAVLGKRQRALLRGEEQMWHDVKVGKYRVTYVFLIKERKWHVVLHLDDGHDRSKVVSQNMGDGHQVFMVLRRHAVERYVQRQVWHDMSHELTEVEYEDYSRRLISQLNLVSFCYNGVGQYFMASCDGGAFIALPFGEDDVTPDVIMIQTFITVSMMKDNQRISNGISSRRTTEMRQDIELIKKGVMI